MAASVYAPPAELPAPEFSDFMKDGRWDAKAEQAAEEKWLAELAEWVKARWGARSPLAGEVVGWGRGDGVARYMVMSTSPLRLIHLPLGDAWRMDAIFERGLTAKDIRAQVSRVKLFGSSKGAGK